MLDEMSIRKQAQYDGTKVLGYVDLGAGITDNSPPVATKALDVYMAVSPTLSGGESGLAHM